MSDARQPLFIEPVPMDLAWNDPKENLKRVETVVRGRLKDSKDVPPESRVFLFPELALSGFVTKNPPLLTAEPLQDLARRYGTAIAAGFPEANPKDKRRPLNALALVAADGSLVAKYHKLHLFTVGKNPESSAYSTGNTAVTCNYRGWKVGFAICFDLRFPALFHAYAKAAVDLMLVPSCWIGGPHKSEQYRTLGAAYSNLTQAYLSAVNRSGKDPFFEYDGSAYVFSPFGENIYRGRACRLEPESIEACRKMSVRSADRPAYKIASA